jgi:hypothetical protein
MTPLEQIARSALSGDALETRSLVQDWLASQPAFATVPKPEEVDSTVMAVSAALVELLSMRFGQTPPAWAEDIGPAPTAIHLLRSAMTMRRLREMCEAEAPLPLRRRKIYAPANYLESV